VPNIETASAWAHEGIEEAYTRGFIPPSLLDTYTANISREEFCVLAVHWVEHLLEKQIDDILKELGLERDPSAFTDTNNPYVLAAFALRIVNGIGNNLFNPDGDITRQEAAVMLTNVHTALGVTTTGFQHAGFADMDETAAWAVEALNFVRGMGIMGGVGNNRFNPLGHYTRQESIITFNRIQIRLAS
jgi:hypothetical protein